jgi:triosephosphate isomerase
MSAVAGPLVGVSLKLYLGYADSRRWLAAVAEQAAELAGVGLFVMPSFPLLPAAAELLAGTGVRFGAQNAHHEQRGPYTGEVSPAMIAELGADFVEVGHAERRALFGESDAVVAAKLAAVAEAGLTPVLCVGETERGDGSAGAVDTVRRQLDAGLVRYPAHAPLVVAYEPVWAIGAPQPAGPGLINAVTAAVRGHLAGRELAVLYGGSARPGLYPELGPDGPDGLFVGRAAHDVHNLVRIVREVRSADRAAARARPLPGALP